VLGKHLVDGYIRELGLHGTFLYTGNFYENMVLRGHMSYNKETDTIIFKQPIIAPDAQRRSSDRTQSPKTHTDMFHSYDAVC
jgi:hypothetical protein